jgi:hypothetical protein
VRHRQRASATPAALSFPYFPVNNSKKTGVRPQPTAARLPVSCRMKTRNARARRRVGRPTWPSITGRNRTKTGKSHNSGFARHATRAIVNISPCAPDRSRCHFSCPRPACGERAQWSVREFEWVRGARHTTPSPIVARGSTELPSPRKRGEGAIMAAELAARCEPLSVISISRCQTAQIISFPRRISAPGFCDFASPTPNRGVGGAPRNVRVLGGTPVGYAITRRTRRLARRLASHSASRRA